MTVKEYTVACLLDNKSCEQLKINIPFIEGKNKPHISLFQFRCDNQLLSFYKNYIRSLEISSKFFTDGINLVEHNLFLDIEDDLTLKKASDNLAEAYFQHCHDKKYLSQITIGNLDIKQTELVKKYGIYWIKENFRPHVTLAYGIDANTKANLIFPDSINVFNPGIYMIDYLGRIASQDSCYRANFLKKSENIDLHDHDTNDNPFYFR